jgi:lipid-A-disaccharide synthase
MSSPTIFFSAAEASGDHHAAKLIRALRKRLPEARFLGAAGPDMQAAGCECVVDLVDSACMLTSAVANLAYYRRMLRKIRTAMQDARPAVFVPTDSPALHWHLCKTAKQIGTKVMYNVAPQVWAWAPWRIKKVRRWTDHVACILPFEQEYFRERGVAATFVGHPLFDELPSQRPPERCPSLVDAWAEKAFRVALLPGSRESEIRKHALAMRRVAETIVRRWPNSRCSFTALTHKTAEHIADATEGTHPEIIVGRTSEILEQSHFAIAASGTVTLQVAHFGVPMVVLYKVPRLGYHLLGKHLLRTRFLSLVNILAGREIVPELMPWYGDWREVQTTSMHCLDELGWLWQTRENLLEVTRPLAAPSPGTAAEHTAELVCRLL